MPDLNPFVFSRPLDPDQLIDREEEIASLLALAEGGHATRLSAPRRYGKTSLLRRLGREAERAGMNYVEVDFYGALSALDVMGRLEEAYERLRSPARRIALATIEALRPRVGVGAGPLRTEVQAAPARQVSRIISGLLDLPLAIYERRGVRTLVGFDEFQALLTIGGGIDGLFRSRIQRHGEAASYIFTGSHHGLMEQLFGEYERPFFGQARAFRLDPLSDGDLAEYIGIRFEQGGRDATPVLEALLDRAKGHPQRAMLLAHHLWEQTPRGGEATPERWQAAVEAVFAELGEALQATWDALSGNEQSVLAAVALGSGSLFKEETLERFNLSKGGAQHARAKLAQGQHLHVVDGAPQLVDPLLAEWIAQTVQPGRVQIDRVGDDLSR